MSPDAVLLIILLLITTEYLLNLVAERLNLSSLKSTPPDALADVYEADEYKRSQEYLKATTRFGSIRTSCATGFVLVFLAVKGPGYVDTLCRSAGYGPIVTGLLFFACIGVALWLTGLPFRIYSTFVIEKRFGFNRTTPKTFVTDMLKEVLLSLLIGIPLLALLIWIFMSYGFSAAIFAWGAMTAFQLVMTVLAAPVILPLFNRFTPLEDGALRTAIESYSRKQNLTLSGIFVMDGSRRSSKSNAFFIGMGPWKRIVLYDTLIENHTAEEIVSVLAHETGHFKLRHIPLQMTLQLGAMGIMFLCLAFSITWEPLYSAVGLSFDPIGGFSPVYGGMFVFGYLYTPISLLTGIVQHRISRRHEYQADAFAADTTGSIAPMISALKRLSRDNLVNLSPHPFYVFLHYSHPDMAQRIEALQKSQNPEQV